MLSLRRSVGVLRSGVQQQQQQQYTSGRQLIVSRFSAAANGRNPDPWKTPGVATATAEATEAEEQQSTLEEEDPSELEYEQDDWISEDEYEDLHYTGVQEPPPSVEEMLEYLDPSNERHPADIIRETVSKSTPFRQSADAVVRAKRLLRPTFKFPNYPDGDFELEKDHTEAKDIWERSKNPDPKKDTIYGRLRRASQLSQFAQDFGLKDTRHEYPKNVRLDRIPVLNPDYFNIPFYRRISLAELASSSGNTRKARRNHENLLEKLKRETQEEIRIMQIRARLLGQDEMTSLPKEAQKILLRSQKAQVERVLKNTHNETLEQLETETAYGEGTIPEEAALEKEEEEDEAVEEINDNGEQTVERPKVGGYLWTQPEYQLDQNGQRILSDEEIRDLRMERFRETARQAIAFLEDPAKATGTNFDPIKYNEDGEVVYPMEDEYSELGAGPKYRDQMPTFDLSQEELDLQSEIAKENGGRNWFSLMDPKWTPDGKIALERDSEILGYGPKVGHMERLVHVNRLRATRDFIRNVREQTFWMQRFAPRDLDELDLSLDVEKLSRGDERIARLLEHGKERLEFAREVLKHDAQKPPADKAELLLEIHAFFRAFPKIYRNYEWMQDTAETENMSRRTRYMRNRHAFKMPSFARFR